MAAAARVLVVAQDLPAGVDPQRNRPRGARDVDGRVAPAVEDEPVDGEAGGVVAADDLAAVVDAVGRSLQDGVRVVDRGELPPVKEEPGAERIHGIVRDAADRWRLRGLSGGGTGLDERREEESGRQGRDPPTTDGRALWRSHADLPGVGAATTSAAKTAAAARAPVIAAVTRRRMLVAVLSVGISVSEVDAMLGLLSGARRLSRCSQLGPVRFGRNAPARSSRAGSSNVAATPRRRQACCACAGRAPERTRETGTARSCPSTPSGDQARLRLPPQSARTAGPPRTRPRRMDPSREAHPARPLHSPRGGRVARIGRSRRLWVSGTPVS